MLRCEAPGCIRKQLIMRLSAAGCSLFSQLSLLLPFNACLTCSNLSLSSQVCQGFPKVSAKISAGSYPRYFRSVKKSQSSLTVLSSPHKRNGARPVLAAPHSKGITCSHSFLSAEFLELIRYELNLCSNDNLNRVLARADHSCDSC